jgi:hypothetical protein
VSKTDYQKITLEDKEPLIKERHRMTAILENVYRRIADEKYDFTETDFSKQYLGKCGTYFAYLKSTGKDVSVDALLKLWGKLNTEHQACSSAISRTERVFQKQMLTEWAELYRELSNDVFAELCERAHS